LGKKRLLIIHNIAWSHYKALLFNETYKLCQRYNIEFKVLHIASTSKDRRNLGSVDFSIHMYPYEVLFDTYYEEVPLLRKISFLLSRVKDFRPHIVVLPGYSDIALWFILLYAEVHNVQVAAVVETNEFDRKRTFLKEYVKKIFLKKCDYVLPCGAKAKEYMRKLGVSEDKMHIVPLTTDVEKIMTLAEDARSHRSEICNKYGIYKENNFVFVGRLSPEKNVRTLIEAFNVVKRNISRAQDWGLVIVGDGPQKEELKTLVSDLKVDGIVFTGGTSWDEVARIMAVCDVFVLPSISEPWGLVVNEAMACGLPVVVSKKAGAYWDLVRDGENGFGFDPESKDELVKMLDHMVNMEQDLEKFGTVSRQIIGNYTIEKAAERFLRALNLSS